MKFKNVKPDFNFPLFKMESEKWELGFVPMMYGIRVRLGKKGDGWCTNDLCCGADAGLRLRVLVYILKELENIPEDIETKKMEKMFPHPSIKPLNLDPIWKNILKII